VDINSSAGLASTSERVATVEVSEQNAKKIENIPEIIEAGAEALSHNASVGAFFGQTASVSLGK
jgi:hypothetical protein